MPLVHGKKAATQAGKSENIRRLSHEIGHSPHVQSREQAIAIALSTARSGAKKKANGGPAGGQRALPLSGFPGEGAREHAFQGPLGSKGAGRDDKHKVDVASGSYVIPADVVSILGEGNTNAGQAVLHMVFPSVDIHGSAPTPPHGVHVGHHQEGGDVGEEGGDVSVPIIAAGGEHVISPERIQAKFGDTDKGHDYLDDFVKEIRKREIARLKSAPPPKK